MPLMAPHFKLRFDRTEIGHLAPRYRYRGRQNGVTRSGFDYGK